VHAGFHFDEQSDAGFLDECELFLGGLVTGNDSVRKDGIEDNGNDQKTKAKSNSEAYRSRESHDAGMSLYILKNTE